MFTREFAYKSAFSTLSSLFKGTWPSTSMEENQARMTTRLECLPRVIMLLGVAVVAMLVVDVALVVVVALALAEDDGLPVLEL